MEAFGGNGTNGNVVLSGHLWIYASRFPPDWDCTPILEQVFDDFAYSGMQGVEIMESMLRRPESISYLKELADKYGIPVTGCSYYGDMWDRSQHVELVEDIELVVENLHKLNAKTFGITVGDAGHKKTESELDAQADLVRKIIAICEKNDVEANLHNHNFEVENNLHDFKGTIERVPEIKLGPDVSWLVRAGVDPVWFIRTYGERMVYLHLRDQHHDGKWTRALGEGITDFPAIARELKKVGFKGRAAIELAAEDNVVTAVREDWKKSRDYVQNVFGW
jgi:sugar phosphate isomerase/epimerase